MMAAVARLPAGARRTLLSICTMTATIMQALDTTIANVALPYMQGSLSASLDQISWVLTSYIVAAAVMTAPVGWLADRFGRKKLFIVCVSGFTFASLLCALSQNIEQIVAFRLLQGMCGAALVPLSQSVMLDAYPIEQRGQAMGIWGVGVMLGPIMGPTLGGFLTENYSWHWVFLVNLPVGILTVAGLLVFMDETKRHEHLRFDWFGFVALAAGIGGLQLMLDRGEQLGWFTSPEIIAELILSIVGFYYFFAHSLTTPEPFVRFAIFRDRNFLIACFFMVIMGLMLFSSMALSTPFMQNILGYPIATAGWVLASRGIGTLIGMLMIGRLLRLIEARYLILIGLTLTAATLYQMTGFTQNTSKHEIVVCGLVQGFGMGFVFIPLSTVAFLTLPPRFRTDGTAMLTLVRNVASSIGISVVIANLSSKTSVFYSQLAERVTPFNDALQHPDVTRWLDLATEQGRALADQMMTVQAAIMAYAVDYALLAAICALAIPFVLAIGSTASLRGKKIVTEVIE
jgi:DHA2 family multidrug resistance protein